MTKQVITVLFFKENKMYFRWLFLLLVVISQGIVALGQTEKIMNPRQINFKLEGRVEEINLSEDYTNLYLKLKVKFDLTNIGDKTLIFWKQDKPTFVGKALSKATSFTPDEILVKIYGGPSIDNSEKWLNLRNSLDKESPSPDVTRILLPNEKWSFDSEITIVAMKANKNTNKLTIKKLKDSSPIWMKVFFEVWSQNIEPDIEKRSNLEFGKKLQSQWKEYGCLWLDDITSEPIPLDLKFSFKGNRF